MMHQCDYCCWYYSMGRGCEAPLNMKGRACEDARKKKDEAENRFDTKRKQTSSKNSNIIKHKENVDNVETTCIKCKKRYTAPSMRDTNVVSGQWIEYTICPDCHHQNLVAWHVW